MKVNKFILYDGEIRLGCVELHKNLLPENPNFSKLFGGGMFVLNTEEKTISLSGKSFDFGKFDKVKAVEFTLPKKFIGYRVVIDE